MGRNEELRLELRNAQIEITKTVTELDSRAQNVSNVLCFLNSVKSWFPSYVENSLKSYNVDKLSNLSLICIKNEMWNIFIIF